MVVNIEYHLINRMQSENITKYPIFIYDRGLLYNCSYNKHITFKTPFISPIRKYLNKLFFVFANTGLTFDNFVKFDIALLQCQTRPWNVCIILIQVVYIYFPEHIDYMVNISKWHSSLRLEKRPITPWLKENTKQLYRHTETQINKTTQR